MALPPFNMPQNAQPLGTPTPVRPVTPGQPMLPGHNAGLTAQQIQGGPALVQGQPGMGQVGGQALLGPNGLPNRPEAMEALIEQQNLAADPQAMADQANAMRIEQILQESTQRSQQQQEQMAGVMSALQQSQQANADFQRQQLAIQQQQLNMQQAAQQAAQRQPWEDPSLQLNEETMANFEDAIPVMDTVSRRNALQAAHETVNAQVSPQIEALQQQIQQLNGQVQQNAQLQGNLFSNGVKQIGEDLGLDFHTLERDPDYIKFENQISNEYRRTTIRDDLQAAMASKDTGQLSTIRHILKTYKDSVTPAPQAELPPAQGQAARFDLQGQPIVEAPAPSPLQEKAGELEQYRGQLMDKLRRQQISPGDFNTEISKVEASMDQLIHQQNMQQQQQQPA